MQNNVVFVLTALIVGFIFLFLLGCGAFAVTLGVPVLLCMFYPLVGAVIVALVVVFFLFMWTCE